MQYDRSASLSRRKTSLARLAHESETVWRNKTWKEEGFKKFIEWGKDKGIPKATLYKYLAIARELLSVAWIRDEDIDGAGFDNCCELVRLARRRKLTPELVERAKKERTRSFLQGVDRELGRGPKDPEFGELLEPSFRGLTHAPTSEQGVVYVFGMVSSELGFRVENVRRSYPDCIGKLKTSENPERWETVRIEFEYRSSDFDHAPDGSDLIVCWEDDLARRGKKAPLQVLELRSAIRKLPKFSPFKERRRGPQP